ncbi:MAG: hypothetical protein ACK56I_28175, partial [bacterium]
RGTEEIREDEPAPAPVGQGKALDPDPCESAGAGADEERTDPALVQSPEQRREGQRQGCRHGPEPPPSMERRLDDAGSGLVAEIEAQRRTGDPVLQPVPGQEGEAGPADGKPDQDANRHCRRARPRVSSRS